MRARTQRRKQSPGPLRTISIPEAGAEYYGIGEAASYAAAARGLIPYIQVGELKRVPIVLMKRRILQADPVADAAARSDA